MNFKLTLNALFQFLQNNQFQPVLQQETNQIYAIQRVKEIELVLFFRIIGDGELLQLMVGMPMPIKEGCIGDVARLLHKINLDVDVPGFGVDEHSGLMFYRIMMLCNNKICDSSLMMKYINIGKKACSEFIEAIAVVAAGKITFEGLLKGERPSNE